MNTTISMDHIVVSAETLQAGIDHVQSVLGVQMAPGGKHPGMGTHNALLGLGDVYLEVIAIDPDAPDPGRARWFDLDNFSGAPRLTNWVARTNNMAATLQAGPSDWGAPMALSRGDLTWTVAIAEDGKLPFDGACPGVIDWGTTAHPSTRLPDVGCRLSDWQITHPDADDLRTTFNALPGGLDAQINAGGFALQARIETPTGLKTLT